MNKIILFALLSIVCSCTNVPEEKVEVEVERVMPNILFIPIDDLRPELGCYGNTLIKTPNIDKLAAQGVTFNRTYCQQAVCNPSRSSLLTGLRPDTIKVWDLDQEFRNTLPNVVTLPQFFKNSGYTSIGIGKTYHNSGTDSLSWTKKVLLKQFPFDPDAVYAGEENLAIQNKKIEKMRADGESPDEFGHYYTKAHSTESADVSDEAYFDGAQTTKAIEILKDLKADNKPFFLSVGYYRPHLPFNAPKKYWDMYDRDSIPLAENQYIPEGSPAYAVHGDRELRRYTGSEDLPLPSEKPWDEARQKEMKHGYYASVSYIDAQVGRLVDELERLGLAENTIIVLWGDHGWKLGNHNSWGKMSNYEIDTRVPLIISGNNVKSKGAMSNALTEFVDIYPTLCEMTGFEVPKYLQGTSLAPLLENPDKAWKTAAYSQYLLGRFIPEAEDIERMGYTIRTDQYRYVEWYLWNKEEQVRGELIGKELFDHFIDPQENKNLAMETAHVETVELLSAQLKAGWRKSKPVN
ncbi:MAG: sulfatase [Flavobacteriales bacterium]|nr:sulfatase [Flavobacteriales bacterium]